MMAGGKQRWLERMEGRVLYPAIISRRCSCPDLGWIFGDKIALSCSCLSGYFALRLGRKEGIMGSL